MSKEDKLRKSFGKIILKFRNDRGIKLFYAYEILTLVEMLLLEIKKEVK